MSRKPYLKMKCVLASENNGETWFIHRIDYLTSAETEYSKSQFEGTKHLEGLTLKPMKRSL